MYDGHNFCGVEIYNPWSILNYAKYKKLDKYWVNTSGNELILNVVKNCDPGVKVLIEKLLLGKKIDFIYNDKTTYQDYVNLNDENSIFNLLLAAGYLTMIKEKALNFNVDATYVKIPNKEVKYLFSDILLKILSNYNINIKRVVDFCNAIFNNNKEELEKILNSMLPSLSVHYINENGYHMYVMGLFDLFTNDDNYIVYSNRESGLGRFDVMIKDKKFNKGIIIEFKVTKDYLEKSALKGLKQIEEKKYYQDLVNDGYKIIYKYAICFKGKESCVR